MKDTLLMPFQRTDAYCVAKELARCVHNARISDAELRDQALRASKSAFLQIAEGLPNNGTAMRRKYFICAQNSACEVAAAIDLALDLNAIAPAHAERAADLARRLRGITVALLR